MGDVFLSYAREDIEIARKLAAVIADRGFSVTWDHDTPAGVSYAQWIEKMLKSSRCVVVLWSPHAVASRWVRNEANWGAEREMLVPVMIDTVEIPWEFSDYQALELCGWKGDTEDAAIEKFLQGVERLVKSTSIFGSTTKTIPPPKVITTFYLGGVTFSINKSFGSLQLIPEPTGIRFLYTPVIEGKDRADAPGYLNLLIPLDAIGGLWATSRAFFFGVESLDENIIMQSDPRNDESDTLVKLMRDKPQNDNNKLEGTESCWLRIVTGRTEEERRRIKMGPRDLLCLEKACLFTSNLAAAHGTHKPAPVNIEIKK